MYALARLWCLRSIHTGPSGWAIRVAAIVTAGCLGFWVAIDRWESQPDPQFFAAGIPLLAWYGLALVGLAAVLRWWCRSPTAPGLLPPLAPMLTVTLGLVPAPLLLFTIGATYLDLAWFLAAGAVIGIHTWLFLARALRAVTGRSQHAAVGIGLVYIAGFIWITDHLDVIPDLWTPAETRVSVAAEAPDVGEAILFDQSSLIDQALSVIKADSTAKPRAFFVGFAGVGAQKVFAQEIKLAAGVLGKKYEIDDRTLSLVNDERDLRGAPLATVAGLKYALRGLSSRMNLERDVLFLSISSHGSDDPAIAVSNSQLPLQDLTDEDLSDALHDSGIKWRVIIISACYAGAFIDSLRDPQTIVITAAAADRSSFGCSNDSDLTYFGEAFYRDSLPTARTLREAFEKAKLAVSVRERAERVTASEPQAFFGAPMEEKLAAFGLHSERRK